MSIRITKKDREAAAAVARWLTPRRWCQGCLAMNSASFPVTPNNPQAVRWCVLGAIEKLAGIERRRRLDRLAFTLYDTCLDYLNDSYGLKSAKKLLRKIATASEPHGAVMDPS